MADGRVIIDIDGDDKGFLQALGTLGSKVDKELGGLQKTLASTGSAFTKYITAPFLLATGAVAAFGIKTAASFEQTSIAFETMLGSAKAGERMFSNLKQFAAETPFELPGILDSAKKLLAFGFAAEDIIPTLRSVGDAAAGLGSGTEGMERMVITLGQIKAKGKVSAEEMLQLAEAGLPAWEAIARKIGVSIPEAMKMAEKGAIDATTGIEALTEMMDAEFGGMMLKQADSLGGLWSTLKDIFTIKLGEGFQKNLEPLKATLGELIETAGPLVDSLVPAFIAILEAAIPVIENVADVLRAFADAPPEIQKAVLGMIAALVLLGPVMQTTAGGLQMVASAKTLLAGTQLATTLGNWGAAFSLVTTNMGASVGMLSGMGGAVTAVSAGYVALAGAAGYAIGSLINKIPIVAEKQKEWGDAIGESIAQTQQEQIYTDEVVASLKARGIELDENNNLTDRGAAQLKALNAERAKEKTAVDLSSGALQEYRDELVAVREEQFGAERADIAFERAKNRLEDAQRDYNEALAEFGPNSREAEDAALNLRDAQLDVEDASKRQAEAQGLVNDKLASIPKPVGGDMQAWMNYFQQIGDKAQYAAAQAAAANQALHGNRRQGGGGTYQIPEYGTGADLRSTGSHLAVVGDEAELIFPMGDVSFAEKYLPILLASLPGRSGSARAGGTAGPSVAYVDRSFNVDASGAMPQSFYEGILAMRSWNAGLVR